MHMFRGQSRSLWSGPSPKNFDYRRRSMRTSVLPVVMLFLPLTERRKFLCANRKSPQTMLRC
jgi:hypothetical protein